MMLGRECFENIRDIVLFALTAGSPIGSAIAQNSTKNSGFAKSLKEKNQIEMGQI